jgi:hypothetical protein
LHNLWVVERKIGKADPIYHVSVVENQKIRVVARIGSKKRMLQHVNNIIEDGKLTQEDLVVAQLKTVKTIYHTNFLTCCFNKIKFSDDKIYKYVSIKKFLTDQDDHNADFTSILSEVYQNLHLSGGRHAIIEWLRCNNLGVYWSIYTDVGEQFLEEERKKEEEMEKVLGAYMAKYVDYM